VSLRKKYWLPIKWWFTELTRREQIEFKSRKAVMVRLKKEQDKLLIAERLGLKTDIKVCESNIDLINWFINAKS
jgi:hypothetical protein